jgi:hypothetical protein
LAVFGLGGLGYWGFKAAGLGEIDAGIAAEAVLVSLVLGWTGSYLFRVITGRMTFMEQRRRYRSAYDALTTDQLRERFESLPPEEQEAILKEVGQL